MSRYALSGKSLFALLFIAATMASGDGVLAGSSALADTARVEPPAFTDLPGVTPADPLGTTTVVKCEQILVDRALGNIEPTRGPRYHTLNVCRRNGGPEFSSPRLPPSNYRQLRGLND